MDKYRPGSYPLTNAYQPNNLPKYHYPPNQKKNIQNSKNYVNQQQENY